MDEISAFGTIVLVVAGGVSLAVVASKLTSYLPIPAPAVFLLAAAVASDVFPSLADAVSIKQVERIGVVALILILFDGGMHVGWRRFRASCVPISVLGIVGTFATALLIAVAAHVLFDFSWATAGIVGAALAPTDPAVVFAVLGRREVRGRSGTILEGESGANDPVGIALMIGMIEIATHDDWSLLTVGGEFMLEMAVGIAAGVAGAAVLLPLMRRSTLPNEGLYPLRTLAAAGVIYGVATFAHGSGFLAVFVAGILIGGAAYPRRDDVERFHTSLASLAEVVVFIALGLSVNKVNLAPVWTDGILIALILAFLARPLATWPLLAPLRLRRNEQLFVMWSGLKGAVPILLAAFVLLEDVGGAERIYAIVFVVVAFSVAEQGGSVPFVARLLTIPMRLAYREDDT